MQISGFIFDLDGTLANTADLKTDRRLPWDVLSIADTEGKDALKFKIDGLDTGLGQALAELLQHGVPVAVVSRSPSAYVSTLLWLLGYDFLAFRAGGAGVTQAQRIKQICEELNIDIASAVYVGDTEGDKEAARIVGCRFATPFWNPKSITHNELWENWSQVTPPHNKTDISPTMRHLISTQIGGDPDLPDYKLHVVVKRILKNSTSVSDLAWLEASPYKYWEVLAKQKAGKPTPAMPQDVAPADGRWQDEVFERMEGVLKSGDLARVLTLKPEKVIWYINRFPESFKRFMYQGNWDQSIVNVSILYALMAAGVLPPTRYIGVPHIPSLVRWSLVKFGWAFSTIQSLQIAPFQNPGDWQWYLAMELREPEFPFRPDGLHSSKISKMDVEYDYWEEDTATLTRNDYEMDQDFLNQLIHSDHHFPAAISVDHQYTFLPHVNPETTKIKAFLPYRSETEVSGQAFWIPIKNWGKDWQSGPETHLHLLEEIALVMARHIALADPLGHKPLIGMPSHPPTEAKPAAASMRLAKRIGEILDREIHWPLVRIEGNFLRASHQDINHLKNGILIDDQLTSGGTYQRACEALGFAPELLVWSCSRLTRPIFPETEPF